MDGGKKREEEKYASVIAFAAIDTSLKHLELTSPAYTHISNWFCCWHFGTFAGCADLALVYLSMVSVSEYHLVY